ncbi:MULTISPECIES: benzaldehyde dehydrogenase [unclassified Streptomyces]|uniref:benzaldehyde dehydrogenase n=1 Tax=unclassified Streptomyces TaxID=2593676 RepID=UPI000DBAA1F3|nr:MULTISPECIES: benzaldehyde dehydrogenase [unclassified Streptomyces]MYT75447.1 aldehyde dehydrogenase family protein [Streptomyces sp. SID8367]RAJ86850.1 benzaldehyde dehydrogenase (NAD) [Streptomyces sp. PsTaAH-137]
MTLLAPALWSGKAAIGGWSTPTGGTADVVEPATGEVLDRIGVAAAEDVAVAAGRAARAQLAWARTPYTERAAVLRRAGDLFTEHAEEIQGWLVREAGSIPGKAAFETTTVAQECYEAAALASRPLGEVLPSAEPRLSFARRVPAGVVGVIAPFNVPLVLGIRSVAPALALGNAVLLKPDLRTAVSGGVAIARVFEEAGLPEDVLHLLPGGAGTGSALVEAPQVRVVSFTGSTAAGRAVGAAAARHLKRAHLELGGNSALIVLPDADLERAASTAAWGSFFHQGQVCMTTGRHLVHADVADEYVERLAEKAAHLPVGDPHKEQVALGPVIDAGQRDKIHALVTASVDGGARLAAGGTYEELFYRPTVLTGVTDASPAYAEEVFGPVAPVRVYADEDEAVALATASSYGLSLGILTRDVMRGLDLAERIPTGLVHINDQTVNDEAVAPFGGVAASGTGARFGGAANIEAFTETRWITARSAPATYPF